MAKSIKDNPSIFGLKVEYVLKELDGLDGYYDSELKTIFVDPRQNKQKLLHTTLHEQLHVLFDRLGYNQTFISGDVQELLCEQLATFFIETYF